MQGEQNNSMWYTPGAIIIGSLIIAGAILSAGNPKTQNSAPQNVPQSSSGSTASISVSQSDHIRGNPSAPVTIVEFSDLQCPFCKQLHEPLQQILAQYGNKVRWVYKHFPLDSIHPEARPAGEASECVWEQKGNNGFWFFVDGVFGNQSRIGSALFDELAQKLQLNMQQFRSCLNQRKYKDKVQADEDMGIKLGVDGTPASFVNGIVVKGALPNQIKAAIDSQIQK